MTDNDLKMDYFVCHQFSFVWMLLLKKDEREGEERMALIMIYTSFESFTRGSWSASSLPSSVSFRFVGWSEAKEPVLRLSILLVKATNNVPMSFGEPLTRKTLRPWSWNDQYMYDHVKDFCSIVAHIIQRFLGDGRQEKITHDKRT